jgi:hypothetical protein
MARNRRNQSAGIRFGPALKALLLCLFLGGSGVGYVRQKNQIYSLADQYKKSELHLEGLRVQNQARIKVLETLQSPRELESRMKTMNLGLVAPRPDQVVHLVEFPPDAARRSSERLLANQGQAYHGRD